MVRIADQTDNAVASGRQHRCEPKRYLAVSASNCDLQADLLLRGGPTWGLVACVLLVPPGDPLRNEAPVLAGRFLPRKVTSVEAVGDAVRHGVRQVLVVRPWYEVVVVSGEDQRGDLNRRQKFLHHLVLLRVMPNKTCRFCEPAQVVGAHVVLVNLRLGGFRCRAFDSRADVYSSIELTHVVEAGRPDHRFEGATCSDRKGDRSTSDRK